MEWNDMSKGKWDVRSRLSADRNKLSLMKCHQCVRIKKALLILTKVVSVNVLDIIMMLCM